MTRVSVLLVFLMAGTAAGAQPTARTNAGILAVTPVSHLGVDLPELERGAEAFELPVGPESADGRPTGPTADAAWRGAKTGFVIGAGIGALVTAAAFAVDVSDGGGVSCEYICAWHLAAAGSVLLTAGTTAVGALLGAANASGRVPTNPRPVRHGGMPGQP